MINMTNHPHKKVYKILWTDAAGVQESSKEWLTIYEAKNRSYELFNDKNISVFYIIYRDKELLVIAGSKAGEAYSDMTMIPIEMIIKIKHIK